MKSSPQLLWPYGTRAALLVALLTWLILFVAILWVRTALAWDEMGSAPVLLAILLLGLLPLGLRLLDHLVGTRAVVDIKGVKFDFSQGSSAAVRRGIELPENVGRPAPVVADSSAMEILATLESATGHEVVRIDIKDGVGWWATRLLALAAGAVRVGAPRAIVILGMKENAQGAFIGWARASALLDALVKSPDVHGPTAVTYGQIYERAQWLARQVALAAAPDVPDPPVTFVPPSPRGVSPLEIQRYINRPGYLQRGDVALEQIVMDLVAQYQLENTPDRLTHTRVEELFGPRLYRNAIDLDQPQEPQIAEVLNDAPEYVALARRKRYEALVRVDVIERQVLRQVMEAMAD